MEEAERLCDRVAIVDHGRIIAIGTPAELVSSLGAEHVIEFSVAEAASLSDDLLRGLPSVEQVNRDGTTYTLTVREVHRAVPALLSALNAHGLEPTHLTTHHATLEDVFMATRSSRISGSSRAWLTKSASLEISNSSTPELGAPPAAPAAGGR